MSYAKMNELTHENPSKEAMKESAQLQIRALQATLSAFSPNTKSQFQTSLRELMPNVETPTKIIDCDFSPLREEKDIENQTPSESSSSEETPVKQPRKGRSKEAKTLAAFRSAVDSKDMRNTLEDLIEEGFELKIKPSNSVKAQYNKNDRTVSVTVVGKFKPVEAQANSEPSSMTMRSNNAGK
jgi:hypothetical protein